MKNKYIFGIVFILWICAGFPVFAQEDDIVTSQQASNVNADLSASSVDASRNIMLARSSAEYRVTAGDVYTLAYSVGATAISYVITVDASYRIRVSNLGIVNGAGKTFMQLKSEVETIVSNNYPLSGVQLVLTQPAIFRVYVDGEVRVTGESPAWGLSRLSSLTGGNLTAYTSLRDISIKSSNGQTQVYDLFKARRLGDLSQDPYLRPGDVITFNRIQRLVTIRGALERPGVYQLLDGENIQELIEFYGNGFTAFADSSRLEIIRQVDSYDVSGDKIFLSNSDIDDNFALVNYDTVTVPTISQLRPVMFVEGAVASTSQALDDLTEATSGARDLTSSNRLVVQFTQGETYASLVRSNTRWFTAVSDTQNAYILRDDQRILINLNPMLYDASFRTEVLVQENDVLVVPFRQYFVTVAGAVINPGRYPYIPDRDWEYYIALAGGFMAGRNAFESIVIADITGQRLKKTDLITPETTITAKTNHFLYQFNQYAPIVTTILSLVTTIFTIVAVTGR